MASFAAPHPHLHRLLPNLNADHLLPWRSKVPRLSPSPSPGCSATIASPRASIRAPSANGRALTFESEAAAEQRRSRLEILEGVSDLQTGHDKTATPSIASQETTSTKFRWSGNMSKLLIDFLVKQEIVGVGVEKLFDESTLVAAAKEVSEKFRTSCDVAKVENLLKSFKTKWTKVEKLKRLNGASWDPITKIISLRGDHYRDYVKVHPKDAMLLNRPIKNYNELAVLFSDDINKKVIETKEDTIGGHCERQPPTAALVSSSASSSGGGSSRSTKHGETDVDIKNLVMKIGELIDAIKDLKPRDFSEELWNAISACEYNERMSVVAFEYFLKNEIEGKVFLVRHPDMRKEWLAKFFSSFL